MTRNVHRQLPACLLLSIAVTAAAAAPPDPAAIDGAAAVDPAEVFAPAPARPASALLPGRWLRPAHAAGSGTRPAGWFDSLLAPPRAPRARQAGAAGLQQGVDAAGAAMDALGRELVPAVGGLRRGFDAALEPERNE